MSTLAYILMATFLGSIGGLVGGFFLLLKEKFALKISHFLASFAAGVLLGTAFFDLLPEALHEGQELNLDIPQWVLAGIVLFFSIERFTHWFHHHGKHHEYRQETKAIIPLIIVGDTIHNFLDGVVIAATFLVNIPLGIVTTFSVFAHEIPQEIGDFGLLLHKGLSRREVIFVNVASALAAFIGAVPTYFLGNILEAYTPVFLALTAGFFIYIATSDLIPEIHHEKKTNLAVIESLLLIFGIIAIFISVSFLEHG